MLELIRSLPAYQQLLDDLKADKHLTGLGLIRSARQPVTAALVKDLKRPILLITNRSDITLRWADELVFWNNQIRPQLFPEPTPLFYEQAAWASNVRRDRLHALTNLALYLIPGAQKPGIPPIIIAPMRAVMARTLPRRDFIIASKTLRVGQKAQPETLQRQWVEIGYESADVVLEPGQFSRRGGILDVFPPAESYPVRIEFFGDEIDTLRYFDPATQRKIESLESILITPAREFLPGKALQKNLTVQEIDEFYLPLIHNAPANILDYLPKDSLVLVDDLDGLRIVASEIEEQAVKLREESIQERTLAADFPIPYLTWSEIQDSLNSHLWLELGRSTSDRTSPFTDLFNPGPRFGGRLKSFMDYLLDRCKEQERVVVVSRQISRLKELWEERQSNCITCSGITFVEGTLGEGWSLLPPEGSRCELLTDSEIFGWERPSPRPTHRRSAEAPEAIYGDLKPGDWVVHIDYGIGRFSGLVQRTLEGSTREYLCIDYDEHDQLFVPVHQADRLSRYIGPSGEEPNATRLGTQEWTQAKQKVGEEVKHVAQDLLELYARRQVASGYAFRPDTHWQGELEASFPYIETVDQLKAIHDVKKDMENPRPMDRLLCGDVGYGKTEVALRAAFKAVMDGKQVAVLVPTTVLAQQHYDTFRQRLAPFPVEIEMLSRFRTPKEQDAIIKRLEAGGVDIIIGTHRLLQSDVIFKDLGLVIVDEEQRFGVTHKEHFKKLRTELDVLTLTATPIPRTLYMALTGVRDISNINTPPEERLPIVTHIGPYSPRLVRQAILRELERGGQVFFLHNRVQTIHAMKAHLNKLVPEARVGIGHGQMPETELSDVMHQFGHGDIDVLLCTSIIESGLDIPNANTLIVDRGDTFGLAQLYQLRGRVGRGAQRAYAYFFRHRKKAPTPEGLERLEVIAENTQLGAGYSIAMRDLEMRGAGELLGTRQSGYIAAVGFHLYTRLLAQSVRDMRRSQGIPDSNNVDTSKEITMPVNVELPLAVGIPIEYIADQNMRLRLYRRIADIQDEEELDALDEEFGDRFGPIPEPVKNLFYQMRIKLRAEQAGLASVSLEGEQIVLRFPPLPDGVSSRQLPDIGSQTRAGKNAYWLPKGTEAGWENHLLEVLSAIIKLCCQKN